MTAFLSTFTNIVKSLLSLLFQWKVAGEVSLGSILVSLFIVRVAFVILIKGANMSGINASSLSRYANRRDRETAKGGKS